MIKALNEAIQKLETSEEVARRIAVEKVSAGCIDDVRDLLNLIENLDKKRKELRSIKKSIPEMRVRPVTMRHRILMYLYKAQGHQAPLTELYTLFADHPRSSVRSAVTYLHRGGFVARGDEPSTWKLTKAGLNVMEDAA